MPERTEHISRSELFTLMTIFVIGSTIILPKARVAGHDAWISILIATLRRFCSGWCCHD